MVIFLVLLKKATYGHNICYNHKVCTKRELEVDMKYLKQFGIILLISFIGEVIHSLVPLPVPASIYGLIIILICFMTGLLKVEAVKEASKFLLEIMPLLFIPAAVGLINSWQVLRSIIIPVGVITAVSTIVVMVCAGRVTQRFMRRKKVEKEGRQ